MPLPHPKPAEILWMMSLSTQLWEPNQSNQYLQVQSVPPVGLPGNGKDGVLFQYFKLTDKSDCQKKQGKIEPHHYFRGKVVPILMRHQRGNLKDFLLFSS